MLQGDVPTLATGNAHAPGIESILIDFSSGSLPSGMTADAQVWCPYIHCASDDRRTHSWSAPHRWFTHWLVVVNLEGMEVIEVDGRSYDIPSGGAYLVQPGSLARLRSPGPSRPAWAHLDLAWDPHRARHPQVHVFTPELGGRRPWLQPDAQVLLGVDLPVLVPKPLLPRFRSGVPTAIRSWRRGDTLSVWRAAQELGLLILACAELLRGETRTSMSPEERLVRAEEAARAGLSAGAGLATMAAAAGLGRSRFCELYTQLRGTTPGSFLRAERLTRAQELLSCPEPSIVEIAAQVGCADATVFGRFFRAATGMTPSSWRIRRRTAPR